MAKEGNTVRTDQRERINPNAKIILVDQDGVLADFEGEFLRRWQEKHPDFPFIPNEERTRFYIADEYPQELKRYIESIYNSRGFMLGLPEVEGAVDALKQMRADGHIVKICTSPLTGNKNCILEKIEWTKRHLGSEWVKDLIFTHDKTLVKGDFLIDDKPFVDGLMTPSWEHIVFDAPYNRGITDGKRRISGWSKWQQILEK